MKLSEFYAALEGTDFVIFQLPDSSLIPEHFHITEAGLTTKHFIDCGGTIRKESFITMQLWAADDYQHRLTAGNLTGILSKAKPLYGVDDLEIEVEYQSDTIGKYGVDFDVNRFLLTQKHTACLAKEICVTDPALNKIESDSPGSLTGDICEPGNGCC